MGNISKANPRGNWPRYPLVVGEVDPGNLLLKKDTIKVIDDRGPEEDEQMTLSNFMAHEDRENGDILLHMSRIFARKYLDWTGDAYLYRIAP